MPSDSRLAKILERLRRASHSKQLKSEFVAAIAEIEDRNVFDDDRGSALKELRQLIAIETDSAAEEPAE